MQRIKGGKNDVTGPHVDTLISILARGSSSRLNQMRCVEIAGFVYRLLQ